MSRTECDGSVVVGPHAGRVEVSLSCNGRLLATRELGPSDRTERVPMLEIAWQAPPLSLPGICEVRAVPKNGPPAAEPAAEPASEPAVEPAAPAPSVVPGTIETYRNKGVWSHLVHAHGENTRAIRYCAQDDPWNEEPCPMCRAGSRPFQFGGPRREFPFTPHRYHVAAPPSDVTIEVSGWPLPATNILVVNYDMGTAEMRFS